MKPQGYTLRVDKEEVIAVLVKWLNGHTAVFKLYGPLKRFRAGNYVKVNMHTYDAVLSKEIYEGVG